MNSSISISKNLQEFGQKCIKDSKGFIEYSNDMKYVYKMLNNKIQGKTKNPGSVWWYDDWYNQ